MPEHFVFSQAGNEATVNNVLQGLRFDGSLMQHTWEKKMERLDKKAGASDLNKMQRLDEKSGAADLPPLPQPERSASPELGLELGKNAFERDSRVQSPDPGMRLSRGMSGTRLSLGLENFANKLGNSDGIILDKQVGSKKLAQKKLAQANDRIKLLESQVVELGKQLQPLQQQNEEQQQNLRRMAKSMAAKTAKLKEVASTSLKDLQSAQVELAKAAIDLSQNEEKIGKLKIESAEKDLAMKEALDNCKREESKLRGERARMAKTRAKSGIDKSKQKASTVKSLKAMNERKPESPDVIKMKNKCSILSMQIESMKADCINQLDKSKEVHEEELKKINKKHEQELSQINKNHNEELKKNLENHKEELSQMIAKHQEELRQVDHEKSEKLKQVMDKHNGQLDELRKQNHEERKVVSIPKSPDMSGFRSYVNDRCAISKALFIGINYIGMGFGTGQLQGCGNDVYHEKETLQKMGFTVVPGINTRLLTDENQGSEPAMLPTKANCLDSFKWLLADVQPGDVLWLHYSGHGVQDTSIPSPERDGVNEAIQPLDYMENGNIMDKVLRRMLVDALPKGSTLYAVMDCCHSGDILDMRYVYDEFTGTLESDNEIKQSQGDAILISGCMSSQESADLPSGVVSEALGALTTKLCNILNDGAKKNLLYTWSSLISQLRLELSANQLSQVPQLESSRRCRVKGRSFKKAFPSLQTYKQTGKFGASDNKVPETARSKKARLLATRTKQEDRPTYESDHEELSEDLDEVDEYNAACNTGYGNEKRQSLTSDLVF